ncbi:hypothetical protein GCM10027184_17190 [Saccharothrix stipae]
MRLVRAGLIISTLVGGALTVPTGTAAAAAQPSYATVHRSTWSSTDSRNPHRNITTGDARVGAWRDDDDKLHISKSYFTFDLAQLQGAAVFSALLRLPEVAANDCAKPRATELWLVKPTGTVSWARQPREKVKLPGPNAPEGCLFDRVTWDLGDAVRQTLAEGGTTLTVVARISADFQDDVAYGRTYDNNPWVYIGYNKPPAKPTGLKLDGMDCGAEPMITASHGPNLHAQVGDPDGPYGLEARFAYWPVAAPDQRREVFPVWAGSGYAAAYFPQDMVQDGGTYAWQVRGEDGFATSEWSEQCLFTADHTRPDVEPTVTSPVYREDGGPPGDGGQGVPGDFTFTANGVADVVAFEYDGIGLPYGRVSADRPGGSATVSLTPVADGPVYLSVTSIDRAGNRSPERSYRFWVRSTGPLIDGSPQLGKPEEFTFTARQEGAVQLTYRLDSGPETTVPLGPDGTAKATITVTEADPEFHELVAWTTNATGQKSGTSMDFFYLDAMRPEVSIDTWEGPIGRERKFSVTATMPDAVSFTYRVDNGPQTTVPASAGGTAELAFTPTEVGWYELSVFSTNGEGVRSGAATVEFHADGAAPVVTSTDYPAWQVSGRPGVKGAFSLSSQLPDVVEYRYWFEGEPERVVPANPDGTASFDFTPTKPGWWYMYVKAVSRTGLVSAHARHDFQVKAFEPTVASPQYPPDGSGGVRVGEPIEFTFTSALPESTEFVYWLEFGPQITVPAGPDGTATITYTPTNAYTHRLRVFSRTPEGYVSGTRDHYFTVRA